MAFLITYLFNCIWHPRWQDPRTVGFIHELAHSKTPLVYDVQELLRWLVDLSVLQLLEEKKLKKADFIVTENYHLRLKPATAKMLVEKIRLNMDTKVPYKNKKQYSYQSILLDCVHQLANFVIGTRKELELKIPNAKVRRSDSVEMRNKILSISTSERKSRGINKSTLWYPKENACSTRQYSHLFKSAIQTCLSCSPKSCHSFPRKIEAN